MLSLLFTFEVGALLTWWHHSSVLLPSFVLLVTWLSICLHCVEAPCLSHTFWVQRTSQGCGRFVRRMSSQVSSFWLVLILVSQCRVGEAANPGPLQDTGFTLGAFNPSGLASKASLVCNQMSHGDVWAVSETHLCPQSLRAFRAGLSFERSDFTCVSGFPAPPRLTACSAGTWKGVAVLSKHPVRKVMAGWPKQVEQSSRVVAAATCVRDLWIHVGVLYGETEGKLHPRYLQTNEMLLNALATQLCTLTKGLRVVAGDFNVLHQSIPAFQLLERAGFRDIQQLAWERWGIPIQKTCKGKTRKDFCYLSPELQTMLVGVQVIPHVFADHSILQGQFATVSHQVPRTIWSPPQSFPWPSQFQVSPDFWRLSEGTVDSRYEQLWGHIETSAAKEVPVKVPKSCLGRARECYTRVVKGSTVAPLRASRAGDVTPHFHGQNQKHVQLFKQVRRLQHYVRHARNKPIPGHTDHGHKLWASILDAKGFLPCFSQWWRQTKHRVPHAPVVCPCTPPSGEVAQAIFDSVVLSLRTFETTLQKQSSQYARARRAKDPNLVFQDLKEGGSMGSEVFIAPTQAKVESFDPEEGRVVLDRPVQWNLQEPVVCHGKPLSVIFADHDCLWIEGSIDVTPDTFVSQQVFHGELPKLMNAFAEYWLQRWDKHRHVPHSQWQQILAFARAHLPRHSFDWDPLNPSSLQVALKQKRKRTSKGLAFLCLICVPCHSPLWPTSVICFLKLNEPASGLSAWSPAG